MSENSNATVSETSPVTMSHKTTSDQVQIPEHVLKQLEHVMAKSSDKTVLSWGNTNNVQLQMSGVKTKLRRSGKIDAEFLRDNNINIFHYLEPHRRVVIAYQYIRGDAKKEPSMRYVRYGAVVFRPETEDDTKPRSKVLNTRFNKQGHTWTAIHRLFEKPVSCKLPFVNMYEFKKSLRKVLFEKGVEAKGKSNKKFMVGLAHENTLTLGKVPEKEQNKARNMSDTDTNTNTSTRKNKLMRNTNVDQSLKTRL